MSKLYLMKIVVLSFSGFICFFVLSSELHSQIQNQKCLICHGKQDFSVKREDGSVKPLFVNDSLLKNSLTQISVVMIATVI